jgi:hypothetical protein
VSRAILAAAAFALFSCASDDETFAPRIEAGLMRLGADADRSRCFAARLGEDRAAKKAAKLIEKSDRRDELRDRVLDADKKTRRAFIAANFVCPRSAAAGQGAGG